MKRNFDPTKLSPEELEVFATVQEFARDRARGVDPRIQKAALGAVVGGAVITAGGALVDQFVGEDNA